MENGLTYPQNVGNTFYACYNIEVETIIAILHNFKI